MKPSQLLSAAEARLTALPNASEMTSRHRRPTLVVGLLLFLGICGWLLSGDVVFGRSTVIATRPEFDRSIDLSAPDAPFIAWPLARVCSETSWFPGLVFVCDNNSGGIGNIRNYILTCLRYGIDAGATGFLLPRIESRSEKNLSHLFRGSKPFDYFFDEQHFRKAMKTSCPQITIYDDKASIPHSPSEKIPHTQKITPNSFGIRGGCDERDLNRHTDAFSARLRNHMITTVETLQQRAISPSNPRLVRFDWGVQWDWPVYKDGPEFTNTFGGLLRFRKDILVLGKAVTAAMLRFAAQHGQRGRFMGIHLRTEHDVLPQWPAFDRQTEVYLHEASRAGFSAAYLATGNATEASKFASKAATPSRLHLATKHQLLQSRPEELKQLKALSWDQQGLVDFVVLLYSDYFVGVSPSSFSINIAGKRHLRDEGMYTRPWKVGRDGDGRSYLVGYYEEYWESWIFMYDSLWP